MYELIQAGERTYYIDCPAKIGIYRLNDRDVILIDSGNDKDAGKKVFKILDANGWKLGGIINTHSNADHIGGNRFLQEKTGCAIFSTGIENAFTRFPLLEPSFLYGGYPFDALRNKMLLASASDPTDLTGQTLPEGLETFPLGGHFFDMIGLRTSDDVYFLADCLFGENILNKYHLSFIYDVKAFLRTLDFIEGLEGKLCIPSHAAATRNIRPLVCANRDKVNEVVEQLLDICREPAHFEKILQQIFTVYNLTMDVNQYVLVGSTVRSYLAYLCDEGKLAYEFSDRMMLWKRV